MLFNVDDFFSSFFSPFNLLLFFYCLLWSLIDVCILPLSPPYPICFFNIVVQSRQFFLCALDCCQSAVRFFSSFFKKKTFFLKLLLFHNLHSFTWLFQSLLTVIIFYYLLSLFAKIHFHTILLYQQIIKDPIDLEWCRIGAKRATWLQRWQETLF